MFVHCERDPTPSHRAHDKNALIKNSQYGASGDHQIGSQLKSKGIPDSKSLAETLDYVCDRLT